MGSEMDFYRGYTHGEFAFLPSSYAASWIGNWLRRNLQEREWNPRFRCWQDKPNSLYALYDREVCRLHVPIAFAPDIKQIVESCGIKVNDNKLPDYELRKIDVKMLPSFTDRPKQVEPIKKCSDPKPGMRGLNLQTGGGKTYCAVKVAVNLGYATVIIVPGLVEQWIEDIEEYTTAKRNIDIYKIEGFQSLALLAQNPTYKPAFFVASTRTMQMFSNKDEGYDLLPWSYAKFFETYGIGTKIVDECHKQFHANTLMDLQTNVPYDLYLSATFDQTSKFCRKLFNQIFPEEMRYGGETYDKYVTVHFYNFCGPVLEKKCTRARGYMHALYEANIMKKEDRFNSHVDGLIIPLITQYYVNRYQSGHKCLVFCSTIEFVDKLVDKLRLRFPELKINGYTANSERSVLMESDLVVSTIGKASTGLDWKGLRCCINTVSVRSPVLTSQMLGRLRKINGEQLIYVDVCDTSIPAQIRHAEDRQRDLRRMASKFFVYNGLSDPNIKVVTYAS